MSAGLGNAMRTLICYARNDEETGLPLVRGTYDDYWPERQPGSWHKHKDRQPSIQGYIL